MTLGEKIKEIRKRFGMSQEEFADLVKLSRQAVTKWESEICFPDIPNFEKIVRTFNLTADILLREEIELPPLTMIHVLDISTQKKSIHISILEDIFNKHWDIYQVSTTPRIKNIKSIIERSSYYIMIKNDVKLFVLFQNNLLIIKELEYDVDLNKITVFDERYKMIDNIVNA